MDDFVNPYTFVRTPDRSTLPWSLGDRPPVGHDRLQGDLWSGRIELVMTTRTPLLVPDQLRSHRDTVDRPSVTPMRRDPYDRVHLPGSAIKGMIRSAYEAVTNGRMGALNSHDRKVTLRRPAAGERLHLGVVRNNRFDRPSLFVSAVTRVKSHLVRDYANGDVVYARIKPESMGWSTSSVSREPLEGRLAEAEVSVRAILRKVGPTISGKTHEHLAVLEILDGDSHPKGLIPHGGPLELRDSVIADFRTVVEDYRDNLIPPPRGCVRPPYASPDTVHPYLSLDDGLVLFATVQGETVTHIAPAAVSRRAAGWTPRSRMDSAGLLPPTTWQQMSSADRLFGTIGESGRPGSGLNYRAQIAPGPAMLPELETRVTKVLERGELHLGALAEPKPQQFRFYTGTKDTQAPLSGLDLEAPQAYGKNSTIRGRKVNVTDIDHCDDQSYWTLNATRPRSSAGTVREFVAHPDTSTDLRSVHEGWVRMGVEFRSIIEVRNLHDDELAALVWLLDAGTSEDRLHKLGLGKGYGFGVMATCIDWTTTRLAQGDDHRARWLGSEVRLTQPDGDAFRSSFEALASTYGLPISDWLAASRGVPSKPVHSPRLPATRPDQEGPPAEGYGWFVQNARLGRSALPLPSPGSTLPRRR